jgi:hypothetical protein
MVANRYELTSSVYRNGEIHNVHCRMLVQYRTFVIGTRGTVWILNFGYQDN